MQFPDVEAISFDIRPTAHSSKRVYVYFEHDDIAVHCLESWKPMRIAMDNLSLWGGVDSKSAFHDPKQFVSWEIETQDDNAVRRMLRRFQWQLRFELRRSRRSQCK